MRRVTIEDLYRVEGKAEPVNGEIVEFTAKGRMPGYAADEIYYSLRTFLKTDPLPGLAVADNKGFHVDLPNCESFSPDAAYYEGENSGMRFFEGAPLFAAGVRSENDYSVVAEQEMVASDASTPVAVFRRGDIADAEPAIPSWTMPVDDLFEQL